MVVVAVIVGLGLFLLGLYQRRKLRASLSWPQTTGTVFATDITETESGNSEDGYSTSFSPEVRYQYEVKGAVYTGTRIGFTGRSYNRPIRAQEVLAAYPVRSQVAVYFNPQKPGDSVLVRQAPGSSVILWVGLGILVLVVAALFR